MAAIRSSRAALARLLLAQNCSSIAPQQSSTFTTLTALGSWWQGATTQAAPAAGLQRVAALLQTSLADVQWLAVPKHKVSPHRKGKRSANKFIRFVPVVAQCSKCQRVFQQQSLPSKCDEDECPAFTLRRPAGPAA